MLTNWIVNAAAELGFPVQSTSIPGVAQRTGATTYYVEILPVPARELGGRRPVLALTPGIGDIDIVLASELLEAGRTVANGFVTPDRTLMIALDQPLLCDQREDGDGDGRYDQERLTKAIERQRASEPAVRYGGAGEAERRDDQCGDAGRARRLRPAADPGRSFRGGDPRRRQGGREQSRAASAPGLRRRAPRRRPRAGSDKRAHGRDGRPRQLGERDRHCMPAAARDIDDRRRAPARRLSGSSATRSSISTACAPIADADDPDRRGRPAAARDRAPSRRAHVLRGRDPVAQAKIDPARMRAHRRRAEGQAGRAVRRGRIPQARHRGDVPDPAAVAGAAASSGWPSGAAGSAATIGAWRSRPPRSPAICASGCWPSCARWRPRHLPLSPRSRRRSRPGSR